ncbi:hypothetical protein [Methylobacterium sp. E-046]|nr:hypothetical protein [Methylobacterium sp. E-046]MCJ2099845.1 hypothetical protein [Methylobacterium sp. E-046]
MQPGDMKPAPVRTNRYGLIAAALLFAALAAFAIYFFLIPSRLPPQ